MSWARRKESRMPDGPGDMADKAHAAAVSFARRQWPQVPVIEHACHLTGQGLKAYVYENSVSHVVEFISGGKVVERWSVSPEGRVIRLDVTERWSAPGALSK